MGASVNPEELTTDSLERRRTRRQLAAYFALAFLITWGLGALIILARPQVEALVGPMGVMNHHWLYYLAVASPSISAIVCSLCFGGLSGLAALGRRFLLPVNLVWIAVALLVLPVALTIFSVLTKAFGGGDGIDLNALWVGAPIMAVMTWALVVDPGGLCEETGWRGYALPRLLKLMSPAWAGIALGLVWGVWHLPAFLVSDLVQSQLGLGWFLGGTMALSVVMAWLFVHANGNVVIAGIIPHLWWNLTFDAHVFRRDALQQQVTVTGLIALALLVSLGPQLVRPLWTGKRSSGMRGAEIGP